MADPYADLAQAPVDMQTTIADAMAKRAMDPAQVALRRDYLSDISLPDDAFAVELGSGTGHVTCDLVDVAGAARALGIEPSKVMADRARTDHAERKNISFEIGDAKSTGLTEDSCDMVLMHTLLCHVPDPQDAVNEAARILKPEGILAICDGDYDTATTAIGEFDPLEQLVKFMIQENVTNLHIMRRIGPLLDAAGFTAGQTRGHGYIATGDAAYFMTVIDRGATIMAERGLIASATAAALKDEARNRLQRNAFFGFMSYVSVIATRKGDPA